MKLSLTNDILTGTHYRKVKVDLAKELSLFAKKLIEDANNAKFI